MQRLSRVTSFNRNYGTLNLAAAHILVSRISSPSRRTTLVDVKKYTGTFLHAVYARRRGGLRSIRTRMLSKSGRTEHTYANMPYMPGIRERTHTLLYTLSLLGTLDARS